MAAGQWCPQERGSENINFLEMKAALYVLKALCRDCHGTAISLKVDNTAAVGAINKMGSRSPICDEVVGDIWEWAQERNVWIRVSHIAGVDNVVADAASRLRHNDELEWGITHKVFQRAMKALHWEPEVDLFASRLNYKLKPFYSLRADPEAL